MSKKRNLFAGLICLIIALVCLVSCVNETPEQAAKKQAETDAQEVLSKLVWDDEDRTKVVSSLSFATQNKNYPGVTISWSSSEEDLISSTGKVNRPDSDDPRNELVGEDLLATVIITATVVAEYTWESNGTQTATTDPISKQFTFTVLAKPEGTDVGTIADVKLRAWNYIYVEQGVDKALVSNSNVTYNVLLNGVVTAKLNAEGANKGFMLHDGTDGIYVYGDNTKVEIGDYVEVIGGVYSYYGSLQVGSDVSVAKSTGKVTLPEYKLVTPQEWEDQNKGLGDDVIGHLGGDLYKVEGYLGYGKNSSTSDEFFITDAYTGEVAWIYYKSYTAEMKAQLEALVGEYVQVAGVGYDRDSRIIKNHLLWDGGIEKVAAPEVDDETKANVALSQISLLETYEEDFNLSDAGVWEIVSGTGIEIVEGVAKVTRGDVKQTVVLKVTVTVGEVSVSKEFTVVIPSLEIVVTPLDQAAEIGAANPNYTAEKYYVEGVITEVKNETYGNIYISDGVNSFYVYGVYINGSKWGEAESKPAVGQVVLLQGVLGAYNGVAQMKNADLISVEYATEHKTVSNKDAEELGLANPNYTADKYNIKGVITEVKNSTYGNVYVKDLYGNSFYVYGIYNFDGTVRYDAMENAPQVGDFVVLSGILGAYNDAPQMKNGWLIQLNEESFVEAEVVEEPLKENQAYKLQLVQTNAGKTLYFTGAMDGYYLATSEDVNAGVDVYVEKVSGGYNLYFLDAENAKHYMGIVASGEHVNAVYDNEKTVFTYSEVLKTVVAVVNEKEYVFGTRNDKSYTTIGANATSYDPFCATLVIVDEITDTPHEHEYVDGVCSCGEKDPDYVAPEVKEVTIKEALELADGIEVIIKGTVDKVEAWNDQYSNMSFTLIDETGSLYVFRCASKVALGDIVTVTGVTGSYNDAKQIAQGSTAVITGHDNSYDVVNENEVTYDFSTYAIGTQYAKGEEHQLDDNTKLTVNGGHLNGQVRIYVDTNVVLSSAKALSALSIYAGNKDATLTVKASVDGVTWVEVTALSITSAYADHEIDLGSAGYKYVELTATGGQVRIKTATLTYAE